MRSFGTNTDAHLAAGGDVVARLFFWVVARNRGTGAPETLGLWTDVYDTIVNIDGEDRTYLGTGSIVRLDPIRARIGMGVREVSLRLSPASAEVATAIRLYDAKGAPAEIHRVLLNPLSMQALDAPHRLFKGEVDTISEPTVVGEESEIELRLRSAGRMTRPLTQSWSDASQRAVDPADGFFRYADISGSVPVVWGEKRAKAKDGSA